MADVNDILWGLYQEHTVQGRHHEDQRLSVTNLLIAVSAGVLGVITFDNHLGREDLPLTVFLIVIGVFGAVFTAKHYERFRLHMERASAYRDALDALLPNTDIKALKEKADEAHKKNYPRLHKFRLRQFWTGLHVLIALFGLVLSGLIIW